MQIGIDGRLPYYQMGGISQYILHLLPALANLDHDNQYTVFHSRRETRSFVPAGAANFHSARLWTPCHHRLERWAVAAEILPAGLDLFHSPDFIPPAGGAKRRVITVHDLNFLYYPQFLTAESRRYYQDQIGWAVRAADAISADSHHTRHDLIEKLAVPPEKVQTIHLAANPIYQQPTTAAAVDQILAKYALPAGFFLFVGTLEPRKNLPMLLELYAELARATSTDVPLVLVGGKGWLYDEIFRKIVDLGLERWVTHLAGVPDADLAHLYRAAAALLLPSHYEGFGLPPLEAMHCGCPVICSNRASLPEVVGAAGILLDPDDRDGWLAAMETVLSDSRQRETMISRGYLQAGRFSWTKTAAATLSLYRGESA
jgi:glycosyltransferase involved in cell wall biosynthesis